MITKYEFGNHVSETSQCKLCEGIGRHSLFGNHLKVAPPLKMNLIIVWVACHLLFMRCHSSVFTVSEEGIFF